jgi:hypothetical protein
MLAEDEHSVDQFGTGLIGIALLIFAYGTIESLRLRLLISVIGLAGSLTFLNHIWRAKTESYHIRDELARDNPLSLRQFIISKVGATMGGVDCIRRQTDQWPVLSQALCGSGQS